MFGSSFFTTFTTLYVYDHLASEPWVGLIQASFFGGYIGGAIIAQHLLHRYTHVATYTAIALLYLGLITIAMLPFSPAVWLASRFLMGVALAILYIIIESWIVIGSPNATRGAALGLYMVGLYFSQSSSQLIVDFIHTGSNLPFYITLGLIAFSITPLLFMRLNPINEQAINRHTIFHFLKANPIGVITCALAGCINGIFFSYTPLFAQKYDLSVSLIMSLTILGGLVFQYPIGTLSDRISRRKMLQWLGLALSLISLLIFAFPGKHLYALTILFGGMAFTMYPISISYVAEHFDSDDFTALCSAQLLVFSLGSIIGPLVSSATLSIWSVDKVYILTAIFALLASITCAKRPLAYKSHVS